VLTNQRGKNYYLFWNEKEGSGNKQKSYIKEIIEEEISDKEI